MNISVKSLDIAKHRTDCHIVAIQEGSKLSDSANKIDVIAGGYIKSILKRGDMSGKLSQTLLLHDVPGITAKRVLLVGCGKPGKLSASQYRQMLKSTASALHSYKIKNAAVFLSDIKLKDSDNAWKIKKVRKAKN